MTKDILVIILHDFLMLKVFTDLMISVSHGWKRPVSHSDCTKFLAIIVEVNHLHNIVDSRKLITLVI